MACESDDIIETRRCRAGYLRRDGLAADARFGKRHVLGDRGIQVMAHHQHVQVLVQRVDRVGPRRIGRGRQHIDSPTAAMMSGAWPPPAPSVWKVWMVRSLNAASVSAR
jgi:hypothetical protein